jgi:mannitol 2-dehydrogenase
MSHPDNPKTVFGYLTAVLKKRKQRDVPLTIQSCDNIQHNGAVAQKMLRSYIKVAAPDLLQWMENHVSFPNSMVDRVTPVTTTADKEQLQEAYDVDDQWPVVSEAFHQWVVEDDFKAGSPPWEQAGVLFVKDVSPYERMKIRLINGSHSLVGLTGRMAGYHYIDEVITDSLFKAFLQQYMDEEVTPVLVTIEGVDLEAYKSQVIQRFGNPHIKDKVDRIIQESATKIPIFILPTLRTNLQTKGGSIRKCVMVVVCWYQYLLEAMEQDRFQEVDDQDGDLLQKSMQAARASGPLAFLKTESLFGDLAESKRFIAAFLNILDRVQHSGIRAALEYELDHPQTSDGL